jgi:hypothetical protein
MKRLPILYVVLAVLVLVSVAPLAIYGLKVIAINRETLETNEKILQNTVTRAVADGLDLHESSMRQQLQTLANTLAPPEKADTAWDVEHIRETLDRFASSNPSLLYVRVLNEQGRGLKAGTYDADSDPFLRKVLERTFTAA